MLEEEYKINYFIENNYIKKNCTKCGNTFWTQDESRNTCGDTPCDIYGFIGNPIFKKSYNLDSMREYYLNFFENRGHKRINSYPVVARWRSDIYLTIASIADFQPFVISGLASPPANPLVISQPCIRLNDIDSVGKTGRHLTTFEMLAHHAFNNSTKEYYWKDDTIRYCNDLLIDLGVKKESITYIENPWSGGGNAGASVEVMVNGLELATLVFMNLKECKNGSINVKNKYYNKMENYIVDTGYGLERFVWASNGSPTIYDALFPQILDELSELSNVKRDIKDPQYIEIFSKNAKLAGIMDVSTNSNILNLRKIIAKEIGMDVFKLKEIMEPIEKLYSIVDHSRCLTFMLCDGIIPSNVKAGYLSRLVIRKTLRLMKDIHLFENISLFELIQMHLKYIPNYQKHIDSLSTIEEILSVETEKYHSTLINGTKIIKKEIEKSSNGITNDKLVELYDSHGIPPETTIEIAKSLKINNMTIPDNFYSLIAEKHCESTKKKIDDFEYFYKIQHLPITRKMYYDEPERFDFEAVVLEIFDNFIILDSTLFYPEGGGQDADHGTITSGMFSYNVIDVKIKNDIIIHEVEASDNGILINKGDIIVGKIDKIRRMIYTRHHTATHIINDAAKKVLGSHIWQAGSQITTQGARLDITHYKKISRDELKEIEKISNRTIIENKKIQFEFLERTDAEQKYGFSLYQGGVPTSKLLRIVKIGSDIEACSGTHCMSTGAVGIIKIVKNERIQDGIERIEFKAGDTAIEYIQEESDLIFDSCSKLNITSDLLLKTIDKFFEDWKKQKKELENIKSYLVDYKYKNMVSNFKLINDIKIYTTYEINIDITILKNISNLILKEDNIGCFFCSLKNNIFQIVISLNSSKYKNIDLKLVSKLLLDKYKYSGGGNNTFCILTLQNKINNKDSDKLYETIYYKFINLITNNFSDLYKNE